MHFQRLRLSGFKSFVEPAELRIEPGLTGVVGPNGCGKSNLLEALRWVMGANSAKAMRGDGMDDVIFGGTDGRPSRNHAEVSLQIDNSERRAPARFNDDAVLEVVRRIDRGAGSSYRVNGVETRARDVQLLFADASTGANSPALVRQGQISELIAAKPSNRRRILEEAAGISGLHSRRHEASLRLSGAEANLLRLDDVVREIETALNRLKREARQAERYRRLAADIRTLQGAALYARWAEAQSGLRDAEAVLADADQAVETSARAAARASARSLTSADGVQPLRDEAMIAQAVVQRLDIEHDRLEREGEQARAEIVRLEANLRRNAEDLAREGQLIEDAASTLARVTRDSGELDAVIAAAPDRTPELQQALVAAEGARGDADREVERLAGETAAETARREGALTRRESARTGLRSAAERLSAAEARWIRVSRALDDTARDRGAAFAETEDAGAAQSRLDAATGALQQAREDVRSAERESSGAGEAEARAREAARIHDDQLRRLRSEAQGLVQLSAVTETGFSPALHHVTAKPGYEAAVAAAFGEDLDAALEAQAPASWVSTPREGSAVEWPRALWPEQAIPLASVMTGPAQLEARMAMTALVDRARGERLQRGLPVGARLISREGDLWRWDGLTVSAVAPRPAAIRLAQRTRLAEIEREVQSAAARAAVTQAAHVGAQEQLARSAEALRKARRAPELLEDQVATAREALDRRARDAARQEARLQALGEAAARLQIEQAEARSALELARTEVQTAQSWWEAAQADADGPPDDDLVARLGEARRAMITARETEARARTAVEAERRAQESRLRRRDSLSRDLTDWTRRTQSAQSRSHTLIGERAGLETDLARARDAPARVFGRLADVLDQRAAAEQRRAAADDGVAAADQAREAAERASRTADQDAAAAREIRATATARLDAARVRSTAASDELRSATQMEPPELGARIAEDAVAIPPDLGGLETHLRALEGERDALGPVNLRAEEEVRELSARLNAMSSDRADLTGAIAKLRDSVASLNDEGRNRLMAAFDVVNASFKSLFVTLFEGGQAELRLAESEDPLEAGLEIYACPPGKRMAVMSLMSGGEQALTATALILAVFLVSPAPVCVLDEVDAPLDDANVDRFCRLLDEMRRRTDTRFIAITHNPVTMSRMDRLFGVTMHERGVSQLVSVDLSRAEALVQ